MRFEELYDGQILDIGSHTVSAEEIIEFARRYDPQPFHIDVQAARASRWSGLIASGFHTCGIAMRLVVDHLLIGSESMGSPGIESVKWQNPVRPGDTLQLRVHVLSVKPSGSGKVGVVRWQWILHNQQNLPVLDLIVTSLFDITSKSSKADPA
jgi:acyl dehydratase